MKALINIFSPEFIEAIGWTIVHSLWQGIIIGVVLSLLIWILNKNSAQIKYLISFFALIIMLTWSGITFSQSYSYAKDKAALKENIQNNPDYIKTYLTQKLQEEASIDRDEKINLNLIEIRTFFLHHFNLVYFIWIIGITFLIIRMFGGLIYSHRLRSYQLMKIGDEWISKIEVFASRLRIKRKVNAFFSPLAKGPMTLGTLKPIILFPVTAFTGLKTKDIEVIIAHELAHILRHDYFFNIIQSFVEIIFFYHPAVWLISAHIRNERENSCDNIAIELIGDKATYVRALAAIEINKAAQGQLAMAFAAPKGNILQRITRLQKQVAMKTNFTENLIAATVVVTGLTLMSFTANKQNKKQSFNVNNEIVEKQENKTKAPTTKTWTEAQKDSLRIELEKNIQRSEELDKVSEEMKAMVEVAMTEDNEELSAEMMEEINNAINDIDLDEIVNTALWEAKQALNEVDFDEIKQDIHEEIDSEEMQQEIHEAQREMDEARREVHEEMRREMEADGDVPDAIINFSIQAAEAGLNVAEAIVTNLPLDEILDGVFDGLDATFDALDNIDFDEIINDLDEDFSEEEINELLREYKREQTYKKQQEYNKQRDTQEELNQLRREQEEMRQQIENERQQLQQERENIEKERQKLQQGKNTQQEKKELSKKERKQKERKAKKEARKMKKATKKQQ